jgi:hypothetical protein
MQHLNKYVDDQSPPPQKKNVEAQWIECLIASVVVLGSNLRTPKLGLMAQSFNTTNSGQEHQDATNLHGLRFLFCPVI